MLKAEHFLSQYQQFRTFLSTPAAGCSTRTPHAACRRGELATVPLPGRQVGFRTRGTKCWGQVFDSPSLPGSGYKSCVQCQGLVTVESGRAKAS